MAKFQPGQSGNPEGRPKGAKNKLAEGFVSALAEDFAEHGTKVIEIVRGDRPHEYLRICASMVPKDFHIQQEGVPLGFVSSIPFVDRDRAIHEWIVSLTEEWTRECGGDISQLSDNQLSIISAGIGDTEMSEEDWDKKYCSSQAVNTGNLQE